MPFNSDTYRLNQYRRDRKAAMAAARVMRDRIAAGDAYDWELDRGVCWHVQRARHASIMVRHQMAIVAIDRSARA